MGIRSRRGAFSGTQVVSQCIEAEKSEQDGVNGADKGLTEQRVGVVKPFVDGPANHRPETRPDQKRHREFDRNISQFLMDRSAHDGLGKNVEKIGAHREDAFYPCGHERRRDDKPTPGADAPGDQPCRQTNSNGNQKNGGRVECRSVGSFPAKPR